MCRWRSGGIGSLAWPGLAKDHAFSLVGLLVVVAFIAALAALVLPSLGTGRDAARKTRCTSNLRQSGMAITAYIRTCAACCPTPLASPPTIVGTEGGPLDFLLAGALGYDLAPDQEETSSTGNPVFFCPAGPFRAT